jgi:hypothetical protein
MFARRMAAERASENLAEVKMLGEATKPDDATKANTESSLTPNT